MNSTAIDGGELQTVNHFLSLDSYAYRFTFERYDEQI